MRIKVIKKIGLAFALWSCVGVMAQQTPSSYVQLGPRPFFLVSQLKPSVLKQKLQSCSNGPFKKSNFSIGHRGAALMFPEHTQESY
jgi:glycerophosphoryl diester phosphodiesterase